jgi:hypothetical protein
MRYIKAFLIGLIGLFIAITLLSLLLPSEVKVSRAVVINASTGKVYAQIANLKNWKNWEPLFASDSAVIHFSDSASGKFPFCDITYRNKQIHISMAELDSASVKFLLQSKGEDDIFNEIDIVPVGVNNGIQVEWKALTKLKWYPWEKFYGIFIDGITGADYEDALNHLKDFVEKNNN